MVDLVLLGDVMLGRRVGDTLAASPPEHPWGDVRERLLAADLLGGNLECVVAGGGTPADKRFNFRVAPEDGIPALEAAGFDLLNLANNHVLDFGEEAFLETLQHIDEAGIARVGAGEDAGEAWEPAYLEAGDLRVGVLGLTDNTPDWAAGPSEPGVAYAPVDVDAEAYGELADRVGRARSACDVLVVTAHWGPNMRRHPPDGYQAFARGLLEAGADVFWGHSAHIFQGVERRGDGLVLYDTGEAVDDYRIDAGKRNDLSFVYGIELGPDGVGDAVLEPIRIDPRACQVNRAEGDDAAWALEKMEELCAGFGTATERVDGDRLRIPAP